MSNSLYVRRLLGLMVLLGALALMAVVYRYFSRSDQSKKHHSSPAASVDLALKTLHFTESTAGQKMWELFAASGEYNKSADLSTLKDLRFIVFRAGKIGPVTVTASHGEYAHGAKVVTLSENVLAKGEDGISFETSRVNYDSERRVFNTSAPVRLVDGGLDVKGVGMELKMDRQEARIHSQVEAVIYPGKSRK